MKNKKLEILILALSILVVILSSYFNLLSKTFLGMYLLFLNVILLINCRKDKNIFVVMFAILYFNFSFVISRYIGTESNTLSDLYANIRFETTMIDSINAQILFFSIINFIVGKKIINHETVLNKKITFPYRKILVLLLDILLIAILIYHLANKITVSTTLLEYSIIPLIFALYLTKNEKMEKIIVEIILLAFSFYSIKNGDRIAVLQFLLADFLINYANKFSRKQVVIFVLIGIFAFTLFGIYGDLLDTNKELGQVTIEYTYNTLTERRFAIDTSIAAYHAGLTIVESIAYYSTSDRIMNGLSYLIAYTPLGSFASNYVPLNVDVQKYRGNLGGGYLTSYFYFWFGWIGIIFISIYISKILLYLNNEKNHGNLYTNMLSVFILSTFPRWYLYAPDLIFRGVLLFSGVYLVISFFFMRNKSVIKEE